MSKCGCNAGCFSKEKRWKRKERGKIGYRGLGKVLKLVRKNEEVVFY